MKNLILWALLACSSVTLISCGKGYKCECPPGKSLTVYTADEYNAQGMCESQSGGSCTY